MSMLRRFLTLALVISFAALSQAQSADPSGHWEGAIHVPDMEVSIEVDLTKSGDGFAGTFSNVTRGMRGLPLSSVAIDGTAVTFGINASGGGSFRATLGGDGKSMSGTFSTRRPDGEPIELPFDLKRTGDAKIDATPKSPAISKQLEGRWSGTIDVEGKALEVGLKLLNHADGTSTGFVITAEGMEVAIGHIEEKAPNVTLDLKNVGGAYAGTMNGEGSEIAGTWTQGAFSAPLTFRRVKS